MMVREDGEACVPSVERDTGDERVRGVLRGGSYTQTIIINKK